jgi:hypothetical protein
VIDSVKLFLFWLFIGVVTGGWIANLVKIFLTDDVFTGEFVLRIVGVFAVPLGAILGFF